MISRTRSLARMAGPLVLTALILTGPGEPGYSQDTGSKSEAPSSESVLERILNHPFATEDDMRTVGGLCLLMSSLSLEPPAQGSDRATRSSMRSFFDEVVAFTSTEPARGERFTIVSFADSDDKAVRRLRDEVRLSPPEGGAILRIYQSRQAMPEEIGSLFRGQVEGITRWCRFIAVDAENKSPQELEDTISHELAHAYICSLLGLSNDNLPRWFHEGVALYLSDAKDRYVSQTRFGTERIAWSPHDYEEFKLIFNYLDSTLGEQSIAEFIREAVRQRAIDGPLRTIIGAANYTELRDLALEWKSRNQKIMLLATGGALFLLIAALMWRGRRRQLKIKAAGEREFERAEKEKQQYAVKVVEELEQMQDSQTMVELLTHERDAMLNAEKMALELVAEGRALAKSGNRAAAKDKFNHALSIAPWSPGVKHAVQQAVNEMNGIHL